MSLKQFQLDLLKFAETIDTNIGLVTQIVTTKLWNKITLRTPVDTGRARAAWGISIGSPTPKSPGPGPFDQTKGTAAPLPDLTAVDGEQAVYILNNVDYVRFLEQGTSEQAPAGMVILSVAEIELELEQELRSRGVEP